LVYLYASREKDERTKKNSDPLWWSSAPPYRSLPISFNIFKFSQIDETENKERLL
jgi:hypothetical protein